MDSRSGSPGRPASPAPGLTAGFRRRGSSKGGRQNLVLLGISSLVSLLILEIALRWLTPHPIHQRSHRVDDPRLGHRLSTTFPEVDAAGFRNPSVADRADLVALGDSHTFGQGVPSAESWPQVVGRELGLRVYNMGVGGYGILHYRELLPAALALEPGHVVVGLYFANDLQLCGKVQQTEPWRAWAEEADFPMHDCPQRFRDRRGPRTRHTAIGSALSHLAKRWQRTPAGPEPGDVIVDDDLNPTVVSHRRIRAHLENTDRSRPEIAAAYEMLMEWIPAADAACRERGTTLVFLLIPSRERVLWNHLVARHRALPESYGSLGPLVRQEGSLVTDMKSFLAREGIAHVDALPWLLRAVASEAGVYRERDDGHPTDRGQRAYARALAETLLRRGLATPGQKKER